MSDLSSEEHDDDPTPICPVTRGYCTGQFCDDYGCAKRAGFWDNEFGEEGGHDRPASADDVAREIAAEYERRRATGVWATDYLEFRITAALQAERARVREDRDLHWRKIMMKLTPGGSEYCTPEEIYAFARHEIDSLREFKRQVFLERNIRAMASAGTAGDEEKPTGGKVLQQLQDKYGVTLKVTGYDPKKAGDEGRGR